MAQAMAMRTPGELTGICEVLYTELHSLGFTEMRNAMINIYDDVKRTFVNYDYSDEIGKSVNHLHYNIHPVIEKQIKQLRSAGEPFSETQFNSMMMLARQGCMSLIEEQRKVLNGLLNL